MKTVKFTLLFLAAIMLAACSQTKTAHDADGKEIKMLYSDLLTITEHDGYVTARIADPWDSTRTLHNYVLVPRGSDITAPLPEGDVIRTPLTSVAVYTSVHCALLDELGAYNCISGICDLQYINLPTLHQDVKAGKIADLGDAMSPNIEGVINLSPDAIMLSPFENNGGYGKLGKLGIPIIECADYMETSPLGRAEWIKFYGLLTGKSREADSIFAATEKNYNETKALAMKAPDRPTVVTEMKIGSTWYVAGAGSTVAIFIRDAGGKYVFNDVKANGAVPYSPEQAFSKAKDADFWLIKYNQATDMTLADLKASWPLNAYMNAYRNGRTYGCNLSLTKFYEETPFHPDILLREYAHILHPTTIECNMKYYKKM